MNHIFIDNLRRLRADKKLTQEQAALWLGVSAQSVSRWECGASDPSTTNLIALAKLFGVAPEDLLREVE